MAKGQKRSNKETRKPKKGSQKPIAPAAGRKPGVALAEPAKKD